MKFTTTFLAILFTLCAVAQSETSNYRIKKMAVKDSIKIDTVSINSSWFLLKTKAQKTIDSTFYKVNYTEALLTFKKPITHDSIIIEYLRYPEFLTKTYKQLDESIIVDNTDDLNKLYKLSQPNQQKDFVPFDGLTTYGSISRGITVGNNQNSVLNSELDLQITGKLNDKVSLRASIQDANIPLQESGYSQRLDEFDQIFIELFSNDWNIRSGDIDLLKTDSYYGNFSKRVQGLSINATLNHPDSKTNLFAAGALVRGQFRRSQFIAQEGNQGPYKLQGPNGELYVLIVSGSETVYVNGIVAERGENKDYIIDYNAGEIIFNATFPITSEMRITVDYQFSERNYSRLIAYGGGRYESDKLKLGVSVYNENDAKNQPLQQNLSDEQVEILANAGDDQTKMIAPSEVRETYSENRILYRKTDVNGVEVFEFTNDPNEELYSVKFSLIGENLGNYILANTSAISNIYEYVPPVNGVPQGQYEPVIKLVAPTKLQMAIINGSYVPSEKTTLSFELAGSKNDLNLFSTIDDDDNDGFAGKIHLDQKIIRHDSTWNLSAFVDLNYLHEDFKTVEPLFNAEFNRDWNIENPIGHQQLVVAGLNLLASEKGWVNYQFEYLDYSENFNGSRHVATAFLNLNKFHLTSNTSYLNTDSNLSTSTFLRTFNRFTFSHKNGWVGTKLSHENNKQEEKLTNKLTPLSQRFSSYEMFTGFGDSTKIFVKIGYKNRVNDSINENTLKKVNTSNTYYLKSKLIQNSNSNLSLYVNYRTLDFTNDSISNEKSLNSRLQYHQKFFKQLVLWNTVFETNSGTLPQQNYTYVEVEPGQGAYTWIDYNNNGIQELEEFELAQFQDQGTFIRVLLPNQVFLQTHQNRLSLSLILNPQQALKADNFWTHFYNQTTYLVDSKTKRDGNSFNLNPFNPDPNNELGLLMNFRNILFFNKGKQRYTTSYTYLSNRAKNTLSFGFIENSIKSHQLHFNHKFLNSWLITLQSALETTESISENFSSKNYNIDELRFHPKLTYLFNENSRFDIYYQYSNKENTIANFETLKQQKYGMSFAFANKQQIGISGEFNFFNNDFTGNASSPVGYQMMEGLQPGKNYTWSLLAQKRITKFLDLNLSYFGRKTEISKAIHTGTVQLKAYF